MITNKTINTGEFSVIVFISSISFLGAVSAETVGNNLVDVALAALLSAIISLLLILPVVTNKTSSYPRNKGIMMLYLIFFLYSIVIDVSSLIHMMHNTVFPQMNSYGFAVIFMGAAVYCAYLGTETAARCSQVAAGILSVCFILVLLASVKHLKASYLQLPLYDGTKGFFGSLWHILGRSMFLPQCLFIFEEVRAEDGKDKLPWKLSTAFMMGGIICAVGMILTLMCLGGYSKTQEFPVFTLASFLDLSPLQRLDILLGISLLLSTLIRLSVTILAVRKCFANIFGEKSKSFSTAVFLLTALMSAVISDAPLLFSKFCLPQITAALGILIGALLPQITTMMKKRGERRKGNA